MDLARFSRHMFSTVWGLRRAFPQHALLSIERAIQQTESKHRGQIRFAVEHALDAAQLLAGMSARERAIEVFGQLRVWDTEHNNGVLIYLLLADHDVEIVADRGIHAHVRQGWESICHDMEEHFRRGEFETGVLAGVRAVGAYLERHFPGDGAAKDELPNEPVVL